MNVYTDGSCDPKSKDGGWGYIILDDKFNFEWHSGGSSTNTTNNRMELTAIINVLDFSLKLNVKEIIIHTDSLLSINCALGKFKRNCNLDLWLNYDELKSKIQVSFKWVKAHNGDYYNEQVDKIAKNYMKNTK